MRCSGCSKPNFLRSWPVARRVAASLACAAVVALSACAPSPIPQPAEPNANRSQATNGNGGDEGSSEAPSTPPAPQACLAKAKALSKEEQVGQLLMVGVATSGLDSDTTEVIRSSKAGSVVLLGKSNVTRSNVAALSAQVGALGTAELPILVATDQEGGNVQRLQGQGFTKIPDALAQGQMNPTAFHAQAETWGEELARAGVRFNLAPVADVVAEADASKNAPVGKLKRQYGSDPAQVGEHVVGFVQSMSKSDVATSLKHFPGLGRVQENTDQKAATDTETVVNDPSWKPFIDGIEAGASSVMISSATFQKIDADHQAVFSRKIITEILREDLGFDGVVISDDLGAAGSVAKVPAGERAVQFLKAGGDLIINADASITPDMADAILGAIEKDAELAGSVTDSAARVMAMKESIGTMECD